MPIPMEVLVTVGTAALAIIGAAAYSIISGNRASVDVDDDGNDELTFSGDGPTTGEQIETEPSPYNSDDTDSGSEDPSTTEQTSDQETTDLTEITGIGPVRAEDFRTAGYESEADLRNATDEELLDVTGIGPRALEQIRGDIGANTPRDD